MQKEADVVCKSRSSCPAAALRAPVERADAPSDATSSEHRNRGTCIHQKPRASAEAVFAEFSLQAQKPKDAQQHPTGAVRMSTHG
ncbi:hypothetical protein cyc_08473 [Cyclospora cayetanensis]|uniref:Uncharacterized protein n=1 Tax=Cyclospora cayetanensis TaxID=88456 RepID=A0A1D3CT17_9EIME|nr:hypothetical protein cyc_08473 [Cyclospora cayetanensis]